MVYKGTNPEVDSYSVFWDNKKLTKTSLSTQLRERNITDIYICGLAYDVCVGKYYNSCCMKRHPDQKVLLHILPHNKTNEQTDRNSIDIYSHPFIPRSCRNTEECIVFDYKEKSLIRKYAPVINNLIHREAVFPFWTIAPSFK